MACEECMCEKDQDEILTYCCQTCGHLKDEHLTEDLPHPTPVLELATWWAEQVESDIQRTVPKISEYGTKDLEAMGRLFAQIRGIEWPSEVAAVWGIMFYAQGKIARAIASLERGEMPSEDTLFDLSIYAMMARSYQARGKL